MFIFIVLIIVMILFIIQIIELDKKEKNPFINYEKRRADNKLKWDEIEKTRKLTTSEIFQKIIDSSEGEPHYTTFSSGIPKPKFFDIDEILEELKEQLEIENYKKTLEKSLKIRKKIDKLKNKNYSR